MKLCKRIKSPVFDTPGVAEAVVFNAQRVNVRAFVSAASLEIRADKSSLFLRAFPCVAELVIVDAFAAAKIGKARRIWTALALLYPVFMWL